MVKLNLKQRRGATLLASAAVACLALSACSADAGSSASADEGKETLKIRVAHGFFSDSVENKVLKETADKVRERTDGAVDLSIYPDNQLGSNADVVEQAVSGGDLIVFVDASGAAEKGVPEMGILSGPWLFDDVEQAEKFSQSDIFSGWTDRLAKEADLRILALNWFDQPRDIIGDADYSEPGALDGVKVRLPPLDAWIRTFKPLGAVPVSLSNGETYGALQQGVVNAAESPPNAMVAAKWGEVSKHLTRTGHILPWLGYAMGEQAFKKLSEENQQILVDEFRSAGVEATKRHAEATDESIEALKKMGVKVHEADIEAFRETTKDFYTKSPNWEPGLVDQIRAAVK